MMRHPGKSFLTFAGAALAAAVGMRLVASDDVVLQPIDPPPQPRKSRYRRMRLADKSKYSGAALRAIRARNGVGRPPHVNLARGCR